MQFTPSQIQRLEWFFSRVHSETYPEGTSEMHEYITESMFRTIASQLMLSGNTKILDIGCGPATAQKVFNEFGCDALGITVNDEDIAACQEKGYPVQKMDMSFLEFPDATFDFLWARHVLEHSVMPYFTLLEFTRVLKDNGFIYIEVPAPETFAHHETNPNHYAVFSSGVWKSLFIKSGLDVYYSNELKVTLDAGEDMYFQFICRKAVV